MKWKRITAAIISIICTVALTGCIAQRPTKQPQTVNPNDALIGISMPIKYLERWSRDGTNLEEKFRELGYHTTIQYADNSTDRQISQIQNMITQKVSALVIAPIDGTVLAPIVDQAYKQGIPVLAYDRLIEGTEGLGYYVSFDNQHVGELQGQFLVDALNLPNTSSTKHIELFGGSPDDPNAAKFFSGAWNKLKPYFESGALVSPSGKIPVSESDWKTIGILGWDSAKAQSEMQTRLNSFYNNNEALDAVLAPNDALALGISQALGGRGFKPGTGWPAITGQDADKANVKNLISGRQAMTVWKDTRALGDRAVKMVDQILRGQKVEISAGKEYDNGKKKVPTYLLEPKVVTKDNVQQTLIDSDFYTAEELGIK
ncbi:sugar-binding protein [Mobiluncus mulieris]|uniref:substrate-binding domain-containing protein n=1 Tax=Mobiluncus mulieris TaxID=2052 RepID=UPI00242C43A8|nr:sugar-binding protein [Mobiluncus mulieris]